MLRRLAILPLLAAARPGRTPAARYALWPEPGPHAGSVAAPDGTTVTPNVVSSTRSWTLRTDGLADVTYRVCLDASAIQGVTNPEQLLVVQRASAREAWTPFASTLDGTRLCAGGLTAWGDLAIGADDAINPVPDAPAPELPTALALTTHPNPTRGRTTVTVAVPTAVAVHAAAYDALGRRVSVLHDGPLGTGTHALALDAARLPPGVYVVRVEAGAVRAARRLTVVQ